MIGMVLRLGHFRLSIRLKSFLRLNRTEKKSQLRYQLKHDQYEETYTTYEYYIDEQRLVLGFVSHI